MFAPIITAPPGEPLTSMVPAIVTSPLASMVTGVLAAFRVNVTVTPAGMLIVVKLSTPVEGSGIVTVHGVGVQVGAKAPSAPVLPLLNVCAIADPFQKAMATTTAPITTLVPARLRLR